MPISILIRVLVGAVATIGVACAVTGIITTTDIIKRIKEYIKKGNSETTTKVEEEDKEDIIGAMISEVSKNRKTVKADILNSKHEVVATEVFTGDGVSDEIREGAIILID